MLKTFYYNNEKHLGQLYVLGKVKNATKEENSYLTNLIASTIKREYYNHQEQKPLEALKLGLQKANIILERFNKDIDFMAAAIYSNQLYLAKTKDNYFNNISQSKLKTSRAKVSKPESPSTDLPKRKIFLPTINNFSKALIVFYLIFVFVLTGASYFAQKQAKKQAVLNEQDILSQAKQKVLQAEAVLIFDQYERAKIFLEQAKNLLTDLPALEEKKVLEEQIQSQLNKSNKISEINNFQIIELPESVSGLIKLKKLLYSFESANNKIYQDNKTISSVSVGIGYFQKAALFEPEDAIVFLTDTPGLAIYSANKKPEKLLVNFPQALIKDIASYNKYIYLLTENQIYKYSRTLNGFAGPYVWLKQKTDFSNALSFAIDGDIYVLDNNQILKFFRGVQQEFNLDFELKKPIKIFTASSLDYIYVLEPARALVFNKLGRLQAQYTSNQFTSLQDIWVSEKDKKIYLLNQQKILEFDIPN